MNKTYWNNNGKYQKEYEKLRTLVPNEGYTDNKYLNALITMSKQYHDLYNNGLGNEDVLFEDFERYIDEVREELDIDYSVYSNVVRSRISIEEIEEPVYVYDEENECETDEIDYYSTQTEEVYEELIEQDYKDFELLTDSVIKLCYKKLIR